MKKMLQFVDKYYLQIKIIACVVFFIFVFFFFIVNFFTWLTRYQDFLRAVFELPYWLNNGVKAYTDHFCVFWMFVLTAIAFALLLAQIFVKSAKVSIVMHILSALTLLAAFIFALCLNLAFMTYIQTLAESIRPFFRVTTFFLTPLLAMVNIILFLYKLKSRSAQ